MKAPHSPATNQESGYEAIQWAYCSYLHDTYWYVSTCTTDRYKYIAGSLGSAALVVRELERIERIDVDAF